MENRPVLDFAKRFFAGTLLSRLSGFFREITMAFCFGSAPELGAFLVAYRFANLFRRLVGEGNLQASFVPHFEALEKKEALLFYRDTTFSLSVVVLALVVLAMGGFGFAARLLPADWGYIATLAMGMAPGLFFISLYALNSGFLNCHKSYFAPAAAPVLFNAVWIVFAWGAKSFPTRDAVWILSLGVTAAFAAQWGLTALQARPFLTLSSREWWRPRLFSSSWKQLIGPMVLGCVGVGAAQLNGVLDAIFSRLADPSGPTFLWYAIRIQQLPFALFGIALAGALLPALSRAMREEALDQYKALFIQGIRHATLLMVPMAFGLFALAGPGLNLLYGHGRFSSEDVRQTLYCLWGYGAGLLPSVFVLLLATGFYAKKSYAFPSVVSVFAVLLNGALNALFVFGFKAGAAMIAFATSLSALANCVILAHGLSKRLGPLFDVSFWIYFAKLSTCGSLAAALALYVGRASGDPTFSLELPFTRALSVQLVQFGSMAIVFLGTFLSVAYAMKVEGLFDLFRLRRSSSLEK